MRRDGLTVLLAGALALCWTAFAGEALDVNGTFEGDGWPKGWGANKPGYWDDEGALTMAKVPDTEKTAVKLESKTKKMHIYGKQFAVGKGDKVIVKAMVRGKGAGSLGAYTYPGGGWVSKEFKAGDEWTEFVAELSFPDKVEKVCLVLGITPGSSVEFMDVTAELEKQEKQEEKK